MYIRLEDKMTKSYYREILTDVLHQAKMEYDLHPDIAMNKSILNQLKDIKEKII